MKTLALLAAVATAAISVPEIAAADVRITGKSAASEEVPYADLDLVSAADRARLERRIRSAAHRLCLREDNGSPTANHDTSCFKAAIAGAVPQMERAVAAAHSRSTLASAAIHLEQEGWK